MTPEHDSAAPPARPTTGGPESDRRWRAALAAWRESLAAMGALDASLYAASRVAQRLTRGRVRIVRYYFTSQPIAPPQQADRSGSFVIEWADAACPHFSAIDRPPAVLAARFAQGASCLVATTRCAEFAGFLWFVVGPYDEDEVRARFVPQPEGAAAWDFDVAIQPRFRMGRLFSYLWARASAELAARGVKHTISRISAFNPASLAAHRRLGAKVVGKALFVCFGDLQLMRASIAPRWHLSWREAQRPVLAIAATPR
jgi:hypothetical protein